MRSALLLLLLAGCMGDIVGERPSGNAPMSPPRAPTLANEPEPMPAIPSSAFDCAPDKDPSVTPLARLSALQYRNTLRDLFAPIGSFNPLTVASAGLAKLPVDDGDMGFSNQDLRFSEAHLTAWYEVAEQLAATISAAPASLTTIAGACARQAPTAQCVGAFLDGFARRVYRRPLTPEERTRYLALNNGQHDGVELFRSLLFSLLMAPQFLYHPEVNGAPTNAAETVLTLDAYELASRLSFHFWQTMPDDGLLAAASNGSLLTEAGYRQQVTRLLNDPRARTTMSRFYAEWFMLGRMTEFPKTTVFTSFVQGTTVGQPGADHLAAADDEIDALTSHYTWQSPGTVTDLLTTDLSFTKSNHLASLYGVTPWDGTSAHPKMPANRSGLLTRMAMLTSGNHLTHPIHRGSVIRRRILCDVLPEPSGLPPDALVVPQPTRDATTRQKFEDKIRNEPCATCHKMMNPIGYVLEQYDAIGRFRTQEKVFDGATGALLSSLNVNSSAQPQVLYDDPSTVSTGLGLSQKVAESGRVEACFARQYFRFANRRTETNADSCMLERIRVAGSKGGSLKAAIEAVALDQAFRTRKVQ